MKKGSKQILWLLTFWLLPSVVSADTSWRILESKNTLSLEGSCAGETVKVELYRMGDTEKPRYTSAARCVEERLVFSDNLLQWNLEEGGYRVVLDGVKNDARNIVIEYPAIMPAAVPASEEVSAHTPAVIVPAAVEMTVTPEEAFEDAQANFGTHLVAMQDAFSVMQLRLAETKYPSFMKLGLEGALSGLGTLLENLNALFWQVESRDVYQEEESDEVVPTPAESVPSAPVSTEELAPLGESVAPLETETPVVVEVPPTASETVE